MTTDTLPVPATQRLTAAECRAVMLGVYAARTERDVWSCPQHGTADAEDWTLVHGPDAGERIECERGCEHFADYDRQASESVEDEMSWLSRVDARCGKIARQARLLARRIIREQARQDRDDDLRARGEV